MEKENLDFWRRRILILDQENLILEQENLDFGSGELDFGAGESWIRSHVWIGMKICKPIKMVELNHFETLDKGPTPDALGQGGANT